MRWLGLALLIAIGVGVFAARSVKLPRSAEPSPPAPTTVALVATPRPAAAPADQAAAQPTVHATPQPGGVRPTAAPTRGPLAAPTARVTSTAHPAVSTGTPTATVGTTPAPTVAAASTRGVHGEVALTFDAGADRGYAEDILDILQEQHVLASFGVTGLWAKANPDLLRRMAADGHLVFNHTLDHRSFTGISDKLGGLSAARRRAELDDADALIAPLLGHTTRPWYRLPYGDDDAQVAADVAPDGYSHKLGWTVDSLGWRGSPSADILTRCLRLAACPLTQKHCSRASNHGCSAASS